MSAEQLESTLMQLPREERRRFADWFYEHEEEILDPQADDSVHPEVKAEILRRREMFLADPTLAEPWDGTAERIHQHLHDRRAQKAAASGG